MVIQQTTAGIWAFVGDFGEGVRAVDFVAGHVVLAAIVARCRSFAHCASMPCRFFIAGAWLPWGLVPS